MSVTHLANTALHPRVILAIAVKRAQGAMISTDFLPERPVNNKVFEYREYGQTDREIGTLAPEVNEGDTTPLDKLGYEMRVKRAKEIRLGTLITEQAQKFLFRDVVKDHVTYITDRIALKQESMAFDELFEVSSVTGALKTTKDLTTSWDETDAEILNDLADAKKRFRDIAHVIPDSLVVGSDGENALLKSVEMKLWRYSGPFTQTPIIEGTIGRLRGLDVWVTDAVKLKDNTDPTAGLIPIVQDRVLVTRRGPDLGFTAIAEPFNSRRIPKPGRRSIMLQMFKTFLPVIIRPRRIYIINNISSSLSTDTALS
ncbi:MAG: hypothetical protein ACTSRA_00315 [Promethearchaeota archaeon]|nr:MAG: hypothetical protein [Helarchaeota virus Nidhogg Meg22_1012]URC17398.1 MAG: hypothetical protein [Helarchaeota virus Nidhogg Meg22_1214]